MRRLLLMTGLAFLGLHGVVGQAREADCGGQVCRVVKPVEINDVLDNPGIGFEDFHGNAEGQFAGVPGIPPSRMAYYRWTWAQLEPQEGVYNFDLIDDALAKSKGRRQSLAFRIMPVWQTSSPKWLTDQGVRSVSAQDGQGSFFTDHNDPKFRTHFEKLVKAVGARYDGNTDIDHVDIGAGCWGEWNTSCCKKDSVPTCKAYYPDEQTSKAIVDWYRTAFRKTELLVPVAGPLSYAIPMGIGWRADCFGDYGYYSPTSNHMEGLYQPTADDPVIGQAWKHSPVFFENCFNMQSWFERGYSIDKILAKGLEWHVSGMNNRSLPVPEPWRAKVEEFRKKMGYRFVVADVRYPQSAEAGKEFTVGSTWLNRGVAPTYKDWKLVYRLRSGSGATVARWTSKTDLRQILPGQFAISDATAIPGSVRTGTYVLDVAICNTEAKAPIVKLAIAGKRPDGWYEIGKVDLKGRR